MRSIRPKTLLALVPVALALAAGAPAPSAEAAWTIKGRGFGHGVGLSQYGAYGFAQQGRSYKQILGHYYRRTKVGRTKGKRVRVLLDSGRGSVGFSGARKACGKRLRPQRDYAFVASGGGVELRREGRRITGCGKGGVARGRGGITIDGLGRYRGSLVAHAGGGDLMLINALGLEAYVKGVVANEVPSSWPKHVLFAQAVVARSYGLATERGGAFDHYADTRSQVYGGRSSETKRTNRAVKRTRRKIVKFRGEPATTYYFSTSGGRTEHSEFGFGAGTKVPYLRSVKDPFDKVSPVHRWTVKLSDGQMDGRLKGLYGGSLREVEIIQRGRSPRIVRARLVGSQSSTIVSGSTLRSRLGLRSTWAKFIRR